MLGIRLLTVPLAFGLCLITPAQAVAQTPDYEPPTRNSAEQLEVRHLRFLAQSADPFSLLTAAEHASRTALDGGDQRDVQIALARAAAALGLLEDATTRYRRHLLPEVDPKLRNRLWFELAQAWEIRGDYAQAQAALDSIYGPVPAEYYGQRVPMDARLLLAQGRADDAATQLRQWLSHGHQDPFARFNLGVALVRSGLLKQGAGELDGVATMEAATDEERALRDKANLVLAFGYLEIGQGATARALFQRVRLDGPYSDKALLGLGWAELAPDGGAQERTVTTEIKCREDAARLLPEGLPVLRRIPRKSCGPARRFRETDKFARKKGAETEVERYKRALIPWLELGQRNPQALAVQEGLAMVPYAYSKIGAPRSASKYYQTAIAQLEPQRQQVERTIEQLDEAETGTGKGLPPSEAAAQAWLAQHVDLYSGVSAPYHEAVVEDERFQAVARHLQDLTVLRQSVLNNLQMLDTLKTRHDNQVAAYAQSGYTAPAVLGQQDAVIKANGERLANMRSRLDAVIGHASDYLRQRALYYANDYKRHTNAYLSQVRLGSAQLIE